MERYPTWAGCFSRAGCLGREINRTEVAFEKDGLLLIIIIGRNTVALGKDVGEGWGLVRFMAEDLNEYNSASRGQCRH